MLLFVLLQMLDFATTLVGFRLGAEEASPFVRLLMYFGPITGVVLSKVLALTLGVSCFAFGRSRVLRLANYWYTVLCIWNVGVIGVSLHASL